jgi:hypothetical protein
LLGSGANRRLAKALHQAVEAGKAVDAEQGRGTSDLTKVLRHFAQRVGAEAQSAKTKTVKTKTVKTKTVKTKTAKTAKPNKKG